MKSVNYLRKPAAQQEHTAPAEPDLLALESYNYELPPDRIAQYPVTPRDSSRLLVLNRDKQRFADATFSSLPVHLQPHDLLVLNDTKVVPARILCERGEVLLVREVEPSCWDCLVFPGKSFKPGTRFTIGDLQAEVMSKSETGRILRIHGDVKSLLLSHGRVPLPPYIDRPPVAADSKRYQTIYARNPGSIAAPTAGMHFTKKIFEALKEREIDICKITLHVGPGTFRTVKRTKVTEHRIDPEYYSCTPAVWKKILNASRVIAVGTTTTRALETISIRNQLSGFTDLFIYPGYEFRLVRGMITNFHLPKSSLLLLVSAFADYKLIRSAYSHAVENNYRFYSYGDAMLIL